jgi:hypothetical protein
MQKKQYKEPTQLVYYKHKHKQNEKPKARLQREEGNSGGSGVAGSRDFFWVVGFSSSFTREITLGAFLSHPLHYWPPIF